MQFSFETTYDQKAVTAMAKALRKTIRKKKSKRSCIFGSIVSILGILLVIRAIMEGEFFRFNTLLTLAAVIVMIAALIWQDAMNGYFARKKILSGTERTKTVFTEEGFGSETEVGKSEWRYDKIIGLAETAEYFVFLFSASHAQVYDKKSLEGGSEDEFRCFIEEMTDKKVEII